MNVVITELDAARIRELDARLRLQGVRASAMNDLVEMVSAEADIVPGERVPADIVTVNSKVTFRDETSDVELTVTLVYPQDFSVADRRISILSPVGRALLGRRVGDRVPLAVPSGPDRQIRVVALEYQPEASGRLDL